MPPNSPEEHLAYFLAFSQSSNKNERPWSIGLKAARYWKTYHDQGSTNDGTLINFTKTLMPYRLEGSGFYNLWQEYIRFIGILPIDRQLPLWNEVFTEANFGDNTIINAEQAQRIVREWHYVQEDYRQNKDTGKRIETVISLIYPYFATNYEWMMLISTINQWLRNQHISSNFLDRVIERSNETRSNARTILLAIPVSYRSAVLNLCNSYGLIIRITQSPQEMVDIVRTERIDGIIFDSEWIVVLNDQNIDVVKELITKSIPSVGLIRKVYPLFDLLFQPPLHQVLTLPFHLDELEAEMKRATILPQGK